MRSSAKTGGDDPGRDVPLGKIDGIEVDAELREAEEGGTSNSLAPDPQALALQRRDQSHGHRRDCEAVRDRPLRRNIAQLSADDDPRRAPDCGEDDERYHDRLQAILSFSCSAHSPLGKVSRHHRDGF